jgi:hypothetical protein
MPGYNSFMSYDPVNGVTLIAWTSLTISLDGQPTANTIMLKMLDQIYTVSPLQLSVALSTRRGRLSRATGVARALPSFDADAWRAGAATRCEPNYFFTSSATTDWSR